VNGVDYLFLDRDAFLTQRPRGSSSRRTRSMATGMARREARSVRHWGGSDAILKIDVQGAQVVKEKVPGPSSSS